jgi:hypothetical protein
MSDDDEPTDNGPIPSTFLEGLKSFDWLKIPGAVRAIARLVTGTAEIGAAWLDAAAAKGQQVAGAIRQETNTRATIKTALAKAAARKAVTDPELVDRVIDRWAEKELQKQVNREAVAAAAVDHLADNTSKATDTEGPNEDWLNLFESIAERANSEDLRDILGRILAGEIRKPGQFSFRTLQFMSLLDHDLARIVQRVRNWVTGGNYIPFSAELKKGENLDAIAVLSDVGLVRIISGYALNFQYDADGFFHLPFGGVCIRLERDGVDPGDIRVEAIAVTPTGAEVFSLLPHDPDFEFVRAHANELKRLGMTSKAIIFMRHTELPDGRLSWSVPMEV